MWSLQELWLARSRAGWPQTPAKTKLKTHQKLKTNLKRQRRHDFSPRTTRWNPQARSGSRVRDGDSTVKWITSGLPTHAQVSAGHSDRSAPPTIWVSPNRYTIFRPLR